MRSTQFKGHHHFSISPGLSLGVPYQESFLQCIELSPSTTQVQMVSSSPCPVIQSHRVATYWQIATPADGHF